jgi:hypothetical protein
VATYTLYNINKVKLEHLLHDFFAGARLDIEIEDRFGRTIKPREWFLVSADVIAEAVSRSEDGSIVDYEFSRDGSAIIKRDQG